MKFNIKEFKKPKLNSPILVEGLPGIGNVGKIAVDFVIDSLNAEKILEITSPNFPHSVFVNEENLIDLPKIELYYKKGKKNDLLYPDFDVTKVRYANTFIKNENISRAELEGIRKAVWEKHFGIKK